jgi:predicted amidohydrolase YtcJ
MEFILVLKNGNILTLDPDHPKTDTVIIRGNRILGVVSEKNLPPNAPHVTVIDCSGKTVLPGFIDPHCHLFGLAESLVTLNLDPRTGIRSIADIQTKIREVSQTPPPKDWIRGRGYNEFYLSEHRHPTRWDLDAAAPGHPVILTHRTGRGRVLNSLALTLVGITTESEDPPEGLIDRVAETGEPTGLLFGMEDYLRKRIPPFQAGQLERGVERLNQEWNAMGITSIQETSPGNDRGRWETVREWKERGFLKTRVNMVAGFQGFHEGENDPLPSQGEEDHLRMGGVKMIIHEITGRLSPTQEELNERVLRIHRTGRQVILHAIEEGTIEAACTAVQHALERFPRSDHRHRIEHGSVCPPSLARRIASLGILVVTQPSFLYYHGDQYLRTVPKEKLNHLYPIATLRNCGVKVAGSSDSPVVPSNPLIGIFSAISRKTESGEAVLREEGIPPLEAIRMFTCHAAEALFEERMKGTITPGKLADLVVLNGDPTVLPVDEFKDLRVEMTILNGEVVYRRRD